MLTAALFLLYLACAGQALEIPKLRRLMVDTRFVGLVS
jgi:hypothetical protein